jgi:hypothetical protein
LRRVRERVVADGTVERQPGEESEPGRVDVFPLEKLTECRRRPDLPRHRDRQERDDSQHQQRYARAFVADTPHGITPAASRNGTRSPADGAGGPEGLQAPARPSGSG